eukprot:tig00021073_g18058.t1
MLFDAGATLSRADKDGKHAGPAADEDDDLGRARASVVELGLHRTRTPPAAAAAGQRSPGLGLGLLARDEPQDIDEAAAAPDAALAAACAAFCPRLVLAHCRGARLREACPGSVVMMLDLAGFSDLVQRAGAGESDMEGVFGAINSCFRAEIELLEEYGADVLSFLGDGLLAIWPVDPYAEASEGAHPRPEPVGAVPPGLPPEEEEEEEEEEGGDAEGRLASALALRAAAAVECALRVQERFEAGVAGGMRLRIAVSAGPLRLHVAGIGGPGPPESRPASGLDFLGSPKPSGRPASSLGSPEMWRGASLRNPDGSPVPGRMVFFVKGAAVTEAGDALADIAPGQVILCGSLMRHIPRTAVVPATRSVRREASHREALQRAATERSLRRLGAPSQSFSGHPAAPLGLQASASFGGVKSEPGSRSESAGRSHAGSFSGPSSSSVAPRALPLVVDPSAAAPLADCCRAVLGLPSGSLAGAMRERAPPLETAEQLALASLFVPFTVRARLGQIAGLGAVDPARYLAEFRPVSVLFGSLELQAGSEGDGGDEGAGPRAVRRAVRTVQALLYAHEGSLRQIVLDDKGLVVIGVFGLYPISHADDAGRCAACALDVREAMEAAGVGCALGLATGPAFCAFVGDPETRCEFSVFGNAVNRAARLMGKAGLTGGGILADGETRAVAEQRVEMEAAGEYNLKGIGPTPAFRPLRVRGRHGQSRRPSIAPGPVDAPGALFGRESEIDTIRGLLEAHASGGLGSRSLASPVAAHVPAAARAPGPQSPLPEAGAGAELPPEGPAPAPRPASLLVVAGETGLGKSALARAAAAMAAAAGWRTAATAALATERQPLAAWRPLLAALFPQGILEAPQAGALAVEEPGMDPAVVGELEALLPAPPPAADPAAPGPGPSPHVARRRSSLSWIPAAAPPDPDPPAAAGAASERERRRPSSHREGPRRRLPRAGSMRSGGRVPATALPAEARAGQLRGALVRLVLSRAAAQRPLLLVFEDVHLADSQSQAVLLRLAEEAAESPAARLLLLVTGRLASEPEGAGLLDRLVGVHRHRLLELLPLDSATVARLACARIGAASLPPQAAAFIASESGGVPFIAADLAGRLREEGTLRVDPATGACTVARPLRNPRPSDGLRSALLWRLDRLAPSQLFAAKIASVVGTRFSAEEVAAILPQLEGGKDKRSAAALQAAAASLAADFAALCAAGVLREAVYEAAGGEFEFALSPLREVVRGLLPVAERRRLHRAFAEFLEAREREPGAPGRRGSSDAASASASASALASASASGSSSELAAGSAAAERLAYHWTAAEEPGAALPYLERCAAAALDGFCNAEAERGYGELLGAYPGAPPVRRATWLAGLAEVGTRTGRFPDTVRHCREALALLGLRIPTSRLGLWAALMYAALEAPRGAGRRPADGVVGDLLVALRQAAAHCGDDALVLYAGFALWRHALERPAGPHFLAIAAGYVATNIALIFPGSGSRALVVAFAKFAFELGSDACTGPYVGIMYRAVAFALVTASEAEEAARVCDFGAEAALRMYARRDVLEMSMYRFLCHLRSGGDAGLLERLFASIQVLRDRELTDDVHTIGSTAVLAFIQNLRDRAPEALEPVEDFYCTRLRGGFAAVAPSMPALFYAVHARTLLATLGPHARAPYSGLSAVQAAREAIQLLSARLSGFMAPDVVCEAACSVFTAWALSPAARLQGHPAAPFARLYLARGAGHGLPPTVGEPEPEPAASIGPAALAALLEAAARNAARWAWNEAAAGAIAVIEGFALSARGAVRPARERFLAAATLGGWAGFEAAAAAAPAPRRPRDCALGLLFAAFHTGPPPPLQAGRAALLAEAARCFALCGDAHGARIAREAALL